MTNNNIKEDNVVHQLSDIKDTIYNKNISSANISNINNDNDNNNTQSEKASWWINELDSLGIKNSNYNKNESNYIQSLEASNKENEETEKINYIAIVTGRVCWILSFIEYFRLLLVILSPPLQIHQYRL